MHCQFQSSGQQKWLSKTSSNNVNDVIYKGKNWYENIQSLNIALHVRGGKNQLSWKVHKHKVLFTLHKTQLLALNITFKILSHTSHSHGFCCHSTNHVQPLLSLRQNNSSNNTASVSLNTMSYIWRYLFRKNRFFSPLCRMILRTACGINTYGKEELEVGRHTVGAVEQLWGPVTASAKPAGREPEIPSRLQSQAEVALLTYSCISQSLDVGWPR